MTKVETRKKTLALVNKARAVMGLETITTLRKGRRLEPSSCPLAKSLGYGVRVGACVEFVDFDSASVTAKAWKQRSSGNQVRYPEVIDKFLELFDDGKYPDLVE